VAADCKIAEGLQETTTSISRFFLPLFFVTAGLQVDVHLTIPMLGLLAVILLFAMGGKLSGTYATARLTGLPSKSSAILAILMNTRGLTELIVLKTGLELGLLDRDLYSTMVVMALMTTVATGPLLNLRRLRLNPPAMGSSQADPQLVK
jgi:Kef-type K+ transport system membrane component KefB